MDHEIKKLNLLILKKNGNVELQIEALKKKYFFEVKTGLFFNFNCF